MKASTICCYLSPLLLSARFQAVLIFFFATFLTSRSKIAYIKSKVLDITYIVIIGIKVTKETAMEVDELVYLDFNPETENLIIKIFITFLSTKIQIVNAILYERGGGQKLLFTHFGLNSF